MPYNPQTYDRRAEIFQNTSANNVNAAMKVAEWVGGLVDKNQADAKKAKALRTTLAAYAPEGDQGKSYTASLQTKSLAELEGLAQQNSLKQALEVIKERKQAFEQNQELGAQQLALGQNRLRGNAALEQVMAGQSGRLAGPGQAAVPPEEMPLPNADGSLPLPAQRNPVNSLQSLIESLRQPGNQGAVNADQFDNLARTLGSLDAAKERNQTETPLQIGAQDVVNLGKLTGNPALANYFQVRQTKNTWTPPFNIAASTPALSAATNPTSGKPMPGWYFDASGKLRDLRNMTQKISSDSDDEASAGKEPNTEAFEKGARVKQNGVLYEFDGKTWNSVK